MKKDRISQELCRALEMVQLYFWPTFLEYCMGRKVEEIHFGFFLLKIKNKVEDTPNERMKTKCCAVL